MNTDKDYLLTIRELSKTLSISIRTLRRMVSQQDIPAIRLGIRTLRFDLDDVVEALKKKTNNEKENRNA